MTNTINQSRCVYKIFNELKMQGKIDQGNNNITRKEYGRIIKSPKEGIGGLYEQSYENQKNQWNEYYKDTPYATGYSCEREH